MSAVGNVNDSVNQVVQTVATGHNNNHNAQVEEKKNEQATEVVEDQFIKSTEEQKTSPTYSKPVARPDMDKINELKAELKNNVGAFKMMVEKLQSSENKYGFPDPTNPGELKDWVNGVLNGQITYDSNTIAEAKLAVSEDGEWGVEAVSDRIVDFAKAISGGDIEQYDKLMDAIKKGFCGAEEEWGRKMPDITKQTYDKTMEKMEAWKHEASAATNTTTQNAVKAASGVANS